MPANVENIDMTRLELVFFLVGITSLALVPSLAFFAIRPAFPLLSLGRSYVKDYTQTRVYKAIRLTRLFLANVVPTDDAVTVAVYDEDLYGVLNVATNATKRELRDAYWNIALKNHPDRNDSIEALYLFRNSSRAYQILKDDQLRAAYDRKIGVSRYLDFIEEVGTEVIKPLAMEVAVPLINMTVQSIGTFAVPFIRDAFDQSSAVFQAVIGTSSSTNETMSENLLSPGTQVDIIKDGDNVLLDSDLFEFDMLTRASLALEKTTQEQNIRRLQGKVASTDEILKSTSLQLEEAYAMESDLMNTLKAQEVEAAIATNSKLLAEKDAAELNSRFLTALERQKMTRKSHETIEATNEAVTKRLQELIRSIGDTLMEIQRLEDALTRARSGLAALQKEQDICKMTLEKTLVEEATCSQELANATSEKDLLESSFKQAERVRLNQTAEADAAIAASRQIESRLNRQKDLRDILDRKAKQLTQKKNTLDAVLNSTVTAWSSRKKQIKLMRDNLIQERRKMEEKLAEEERRRKKEEEEREIKNLKIQRDKRSAELAQIEANRQKLLKELSAQEERLSALSKQQDQDSDSTPTMPSN